MDIPRSLKEILTTLPSDGKVTLVAVSKFHPAESVIAAYDAGQRVFGESRVQELVAKAAELPDDIQWHYIGHLQTNKVSQLLKVSNLSLIESVDSFKLLDVLETTAQKLSRMIDILLEIHVAREETKSGFNTAELISWYKNGGPSNLKFLRIRGLMGMATNTDDETDIRKDFQSITTCFNKIKELSSTSEDFDILSMGMSGDYQIAIGEGSNMVRIGSSIFGERSY